MMNTRLLAIPVIAAAFLSLASCSNKDSTELRSGIILKNMDTTVNPGNNFTQYVNGTWVKNTKLPADKSSYGAGSIVNDEAQENVKAIIENAAKAKGKDGSEEQKIGDLYDSYLNMKVRDSIGLAPLNEEFKKIDAIKTAKDFVNYLGYANKVGLKIPFNVSVTEDFKDPKNYMLLTWQGGLGLPDREYYFLKDAKSSEIRAKYLAHIERMLQLSGVTDAKAKAAKILALETALAGNHMKKEDTRNMGALYNKYAIKDLGKLTPDFDWNGFLSAAGIKGQDSLVVTQVAYTKDLNSILKGTPLDVWKDYFKWGAITGASTLLTTALDQANFDFYAKTLYGVQQQKPQWRRAVDMVNGNLGEMVGKLYVEKHFPPAAKERMLKLVNNLLKAYEESIKTLDWMSPETKKQALVKISKFTPKIGYPDTWKDYGALKVKKNDLYGNSLRATEFEYNRTIGKLGKPVDRKEWGMTPQTVNAYYNPTMNEIVFPAAILQPPYFDMEAEDAVNYGGIGAVIGHEIGHGFDDQGATFDGDGVLRNWWTPKDLSEFKKRTNALVAQYNSFKVFPDLTVNGTFTLGENIGDLGGLSIAMKAYKASLEGKPAPVMDGFTGEQRVLIGWAQAWLNKANDQSLRNQVGTDPHSPATFRVNGVVRNIPEFYEAFKVKPGDSLYLAPKDRVKIW